VSGFIYFATLLAMVMVVYIHALTVKFDAGAIQFVSLVKFQGYFSKNLFHVALPVFFSISGFLLFYGAGCISDITTRQKKRVKSLVIPYLLWSIIWTCVLLIAQQYAQVDFGKHSDMLGVADTLFHITLDPVANQFWYIRDLIVLVIIAPIVFIVSDRILVIVTIAFIFMWAVFPSPTVISERSGLFAVVSVEAVAWFLLGVVFARDNNVVRIEHMLRRKSKTLAVISLIVFFAPPLVMVSHPEISSLLRALSITSGYLFMISIYGFVCDSFCQDKVKTYSSYSFIVYAAHYPTIKVLGTVAFMVLPSTLGAHMAVYIILPLLTIIGIIVAVNLAAKIAPNIVLALNGYRKLAI
jgi:hypothetical protein